MSSLSNKLLNQRASPKTFKNEQQSNCLSKVANSKVARDRKYLITLPDAKSLNSERKLTKLLVMTGEDRF